MKVKIKNENEYGKGHILPVIGIVQISDDGIVDVPDDFAEMLVNSSTDWEKVEEVVEQKKVTKPSKVLVDDKKDSEQLPLDEKEQNKIRVTLLKLTERDLKVIVDEIQTPKTEKNKFVKNKNLMVSYIINNIPTQKLREFIKNGTNHI